MKWVICTEFGTNRLLKEGAKVVLSAKDIIDYFPEIEYKEILEKKRVNENIINPKYLEIYKIISKRSIDCNEISRTIKKPINEVNSILFMMELEGLIKRLPSGEYLIGE